METLTESKTDYALHIAHVLSEVYTFAMRGYIHENAEALAYLYAAVPMPDADALSGAVNDVTLDLLTYSRTLALHWTNLVEVKAQVAIADAMQLCGQGSRRLRNQRREVDVTASQTFWLTYWNTKRPV